MEKYIALLRGINVGGHNKLSMVELKHSFEEDGFENVVTYINSGNIIFTTDKKINVLELKNKCEILIKKNFKLDIVVSIISAKALKESLANAPIWWDTNQESKHNAIFVISPTTTQEVIELIGATKPEYEQIGYYGQIIFWSAPIKTFSRTKLSKIVNTNLYNKITIRNANTTKKLLQLIC